jgi:hypothetical protein
MIMCKKTLKSALGVLLALVVLLWVVKAYRDAHYFDNYDPGAPLNITVSETTEVNKGTPDFSKLLDSYANHLGVAVALGLIDGRNLNPEKPPLPKLTPSQERKVGVAIGCLKPVARYFLGVADPIHYAGQISPRPVYFQNGKYDVLVPASAGKALQDATQEPKKITWYESDHVGIDLEHTRRVLEDGLKWLLEQDDPFRAPEERVTNLPPFEIKKT